MIGAMIGQPIMHAYPDAPYTIAVSDEVGYAAAAGSIITGIAAASMVQRVATNAITLYCPETSGILGSIGRAVLQKVVNLDTNRLLRVTGGLGAWMAYFFWYQITASKQAKRAEYIKSESGLSGALEKAENQLTAILAAINTGENANSLDYKKIQKKLAGIRDALKLAASTLKAAKDADPFFESKFKEMDAIYKSIAAKLTILEGHMERQSVGAPTASGGATSSSSIIASSYKTFKRYSYKPVLIGVEAVEYAWKMLSKPEILAATGTLYWGPEIFGVMKNVATSIAQLFRSPEAVAAMVKNR